MKTTSMIATAVAAFLWTFTIGCGPAAPTNVDTDTSAGSNTTDGGNTTAGSETPAGETP